MRNILYIPLFKENNSPLYQLSLLIEEEISNNSRQIQQYQISRSERFRCQDIIIYIQCISTIQSLNIIYKSLSYNRKTRRTEVLRASYAWTQSYLAITLYIIYLLISDYSMMEATRPEPTVRPPSRIANVRPCSIAIG